MSTPKTKKIPMRQCIGCGRMNEKRQMCRVLKTQEGELILDASGRGNGRGAYLCRSQECLDLAIRSRGLERSFKMPIDRQVYERLQEEMRQEP